MGSRVSGTGQTAARDQWLSASGQTGGCGGGQIGVPVARSFTGEPLILAYTELL